jgi:mycothiol system anti-sigma-R factor
VSPELNESDCSEALHRVFEYLDGELPDHERSKIAAHLAHCAACLQQYDIDTMVKGLVKRSCAQESAPTHLRGLIIQRITAVEITYVD